MNPQIVDSSPKESVRILLSEIVDYAGLFPPSQIAMPEAVVNYATYRKSNYSWMLGRFITPVSRLDEFLESASEFIARDGSDPWRVSALAGGTRVLRVTEPEDVLFRMPPDPVVRDRALRSEALVTAAKDFHITSAAGTDSCSR